MYSALLFNLLVCLCEAWMVLTVARGVECELVYAFQPEALHGGLCRPANDISNVVDSAFGTETPHSTSTNTAWVYHDPLLDYVVITLAQVIDMEQRKAESLTILWTIWMDESASTSLDVMGPISHLFYFTSITPCYPFYKCYPDDCWEFWLNGVYENVLTELDLILQNDISLIESFF